MSADNLKHNRLNYAADLLVAVTFGIYVTLAAICIHFLLERRRSGRIHRIILWYTVTLLFTGTIWFASGAWFGERELVELQPSIIDQFSGPPNTLYYIRLVKNVCYTFNIYLAGGLLLYRLFIIWGRSILVVVIAGLVWLGVVAAGIATLVLTSLPNANFQATHITNPETLFIYLSVSLNILCTLLIAGRLVVQQQVAKELGATSAKTYPSVVVVIVESAALYSLFGIIYIPLMVLQRPVWFLFSSLIGTLTLIAPNLIILRMALAAGAPARDVDQGTTLPDFGESTGKAAPAPGVTAGDSISQATVTESRMVPDAYNSVASTGQIHKSKGHSSERMLPDHRNEKEKVMVQSSGGVWAVIA